MTSTQLATAVQWATVLSPVATAIVGVLTVWVIYRQVRLAREIDKASRALTFRLKQADVLQSFNLRYEKMWEVRRRPHEEDDPLMFFLQYWSLQVDQYEAWKTDLVPDQVFRMWMLQRSADFSANWSFKGLTFGNAWDDCHRKLVANAEFVKIVNAMRVPAPEIDVVMKESKLGYRLPA